ncbi:hypothetical protein WN48_04679 [Eufriesea mexicana]|uniref:Uncharacterized protein n=1 Tax=Eufriesea mexicana TaxID=516756 RepID=A0A310SG56_9HYME|nr:hypothetical protein WN48_04679 [Eufriesea mexicana]
MKLLVSTRGPCWAVAGQDRHFASQPHGVELNHPCGLTVDGTSPSASMCPSPSRVRLRQRTAPSRSEDALIRGGHPGTRCMTRLTVTGNECRRRVLLAWYRFPKIILWKTIPITRSHHEEVATHRDPTCALVAQPTGATCVKGNDRREQVKNRDAPERVRDYSKDRLAYETYSLVQDNFVPRHPPESNLAHPATTDPAMTYSRTRMVDEPTKHPKSSRGSLARPCSRSRRPLPHGGEINHPMGSDRRPICNVRLQDPYPGRARAGAQDD